MLSAASLTSEKLGVYLTVNIFCFLIHFLCSEIQFPNNNLCEVALFSALICVFQDHYNYNGNPSPKFSVQHNKVLRH